jgi:hypothetical protein
MTGKKREGGFTMKRAWIVALALAIPPLAGFECTIEGNIGIEAGDSCDYWWDYDDARCDGDTIIYCAEDNWVYAADCFDQCGGAGSCGYDSGFGYNACICEVSCGWEAGCDCSYLTQYDAGTCAGDFLTWCGEDNLIAEVDCTSYCTVDYGATSGSCGTMPETGYNGCVCVWEACDFEAYCYDALWMVYCDPAQGAVWMDCDGDCVNQGFTKGVCDAGTGQCACN